MAFGAIAQLVARFHGMEEVAGSIPASSTRTRSVEPYSFSRMSSRLSINSRVANSSPRFFCLQEKQDFKNKRQSVCLTALSRRSPHEEDEPGTGKRRGVWKNSF